MHHGAAYNKLKFKINGNTIEHINLSTTTRLNFDKLIHIAGKANDD